MRNIAFLLPVYFLMLGVTCSGETQRELNEAAEKEFRKADDELNAVYKRLLQTLGDDAKAKLHKAEAAWVKFRDAECDSEADEYRGGTIMPLIYFRCAARLTKTRTGELRERLEHDH